MVKLGGKSGLGLFPSDWDLPNPPPRETHFLFFLPPSPSPPDTLVHFCRFRHFFYFLLGGGGVRMVRLDVALIMGNGGVSPNSF